MAEKGGGVLESDWCSNINYSEATRAQGDDEVAGADNEATEHDVSTAASADPNSESGALHTVEVSVQSINQLITFINRGIRVPPDIRQTKLLYI